MRILLLAHLFPPARTAGTEQYALGLALGLCRRGHDVHVVCAEGWETGDRYWNGVTQDVHQGVPVHRLHLNWTKAHDPNRVLYDSPDVEAWVEGFARTLEPDVAHVVSLHTLGAGVLRALGRTGTPSVMALTDYWFLCPKGNLLTAGGALCDADVTPFDCQSCLCAASRRFRLLNAVVPPPLRAATWARLSRGGRLGRQRGFRGFLLDVGERAAVLGEATGTPRFVYSPSRFLQALVAKRTGVPVAFLPHGHDLSWLNDYHGKTPGEGVRFGYVGQLTAMKGVHLLLEAFGASGAAASASLDIWGPAPPDPSYAARLAAAAGGVRRVTMRGRYARTDLGRIFAAIDVLVVPSLWYENAPLAIQEAFATRTPVIATDLGGMSEAVHHEVNGLLFARGDARSLAAQLRRVVDDPGLLPRLSAAAPPVRTADDEVAELESLYRQLVTGVPAA